MPGPIDVTLRTPNGDVYVGQAVAVVVDKLTLTSILPTQFVSGVATNFSITGTGFQAGMTVQLGSVMATNVQVLSATQASGTATL